jgi:polyphenol oxidase
VTTQAFVQRLVTTRRGLGGPVAGVSLPPYDSFNLGAGVGDEVNAVQANRSAVAKAAGLAPDALIWMNQVHGTVIAEIVGPGSDPPPGTDGMVSTARGVGLAVAVADCVPVLAVDPVAGVIGAVHAGRLGAAGGIVPVLIGRMIDLGAHPENLEVIVGPAICGRCYEVPAAMRDDVESHLPGSACVTNEGTPGLDLRAGLLRQLRDAGVGSIEVDPRCTREDPDLFSHRRSAPTGRFAAVIWQ